MAFSSEVFEALDSNHITCISPLLCLSGLRVEIPKPPTPRGEGWSSVSPWSFPKCKVHKEDAGQAGFPESHLRPHTPTAVASTVQATRERTEV